MFLLNLILAPSIGPIEFRYDRLAIFYADLKNSILITVKLQNSRKMMQLKFSVMTKHDEFALMRVQKNEQALRAAFNERMLMISEEDTNRPEFRNELRNDLKVVANDTMRRIEGYDFDIVEEVLLTSYVVE